MSLLAPILRSLLGELRHDDDPDRKDPAVECSVPAVATTEEPEAGPLSELERSDGMADISASDHEERSVS